MNCLKPLSSAKAGLLLMGFLAAISHSAFAANVINLASLGATDVVDWSVTHPASAQSFTVGDVTVSEPSSIFKQLIQGLDGWSGNFPVGTYVEYDQEPSGPITFTFSKPVEGFGLTVNDDFCCSFIANITKFDGTRRLGSYSTSASQGSLVFLGVKDPTFDITSVTVGINGLGGDNACAFGNLSLIDTASTSDAPEPSTAGLIGVSFLTAMFGIRRAFTRSLARAMFAKFALVGSACALAVIPAFASETYSYAGSQFLLPDHQQHWKHHLSTRLEYPSVGRNWPTLRSANLYG